MPRVHTQVAAKDYPNQGIKKGDTYFKWKFRYSGVIRSKTYPKPSQLTQSEFLSQAYEFGERIQDIVGGFDRDGDLESMSEIKDQFDGLIDEIRDLGSEQEDKLYNMPDSLQQGPTGELLTQRAEMMEEWASNIEGIDWPELPEDPTGDEPDQPEEPDEDDFESEEDYQAAYSEFEEQMGEWEEWESSLSDYESDVEDYRNNMESAVEQASGYEYEGE